MLELEAPLNFRHSDFHQDRLNPLDFLDFWTSTTVRWFFWTDERKCPASLTPSLENSDTPTSGHSKSPDGSLPRCGGPSGPPLGPPPVLHGPGAVQDARPTSSDDLLQNYVYRQQAHHRHHRTKWVHHKIQYFILNPSELIKPLRSDFLPLNSALFLVLKRKRKSCRAWPKELSKSKY